MIYTIGFIEFYLEPLEEYLYSRFYEVIDICELVLLDKTKHDDLFLILPSHGKGRILLELPSFNPLAQFRFVF